MIRLYRLPIILHDLLMVALAWVLAILVRYNFQPDVIEFSVLYMLPVIVGVQGWVLWYYGLYRSIWRFTGMYDFALLLRSAILGTLAIALVLFILIRLDNVPRSSLLFYPFILIFLLGMPRLLYRLGYEHSLKFLLDERLPPQRVLVLGAGTSGEMLVRDMLRRRHCSYVPMGFLDDQAQLWGGKVQGLPVLGKINQLTDVASELAIDLIIIAIPSATDDEMQHIVELCESCQIPFRILPKIEHLAASEAHLQALRHVAIEDLLGREKVALDWQIVQAKLTGKVVMVSGGGGSIGAELCRQIAQLQPAMLVILERSEFNLYQVEMQLKQFLQLNLQLCLGDITDTVAVEHCLRQFKPQIIFHAAAYKHVPMLQFQAREAVRNNVIGTQILANYANFYQCETFVLISTDKAVHPTNVMGSSKRAAEIFCQSLNSRSTTRFVTVRFGNVLGSAGSVVPLFQMQINQGGPVTVTHPDISRYFMTIPEASQLILQAAAMGNGGEIFVLDMGKPVKIRYLAEQMIRLAGKIPDVDIPIVYTGLRPGEKLHEELFYAEEVRKTTHSKILLASPVQYSWETLEAQLQALSEACHQYAEAEVMALLQQIVLSDEQSQIN